VRGRPASAPPRPHGRAARAGDLRIPIAAPLPLEQAATAHDRVNRNNRQRILLAIPD
jgi:NADPH2:quinone reductase